MGLYFVTTGWIFDMGLCDISIQIQFKALLSHVIKRFSRELISVEVREVQTGCQPIMGDIKEIFSPCSTESGVGEM